jgi:mannosyltransferase OCH1-like enzyme
MIPFKVFTYWEGPQPGYIQHCLSTFKRLGVEFVILNPKNTDEYIRPTGLHANWKRLSNIAQKADCLRVALMKHYGGMWIDADTVLLKNAKHLFKERGECMMCQWDSDGALSNGYLMAQPNSKFFTEVLKIINDKLENDFRPLYNDYSGCDMGEAIYERVRKQIPPTIMSRTIFLPIEFRGHPNIWNENTPIGKYLQPDTVGIGLNNSQYTNPVFKSGLDKIKTHKGLFGNIFNYSLGKK